MDERARRSSQSRSACQWMSAVVLWVTSGWRRSAETRFAVVSGRRCSSRLVASSGWSSSRSLIPMLQAVAASHARSRDSGPSGPMNGDTKSSLPMDADEGAPAPGRCGRTAYTGGARRRCCGLRRRPCAALRPRRGTGRSGRIEHVAQDAQVGHERDPPSSRLEARATQVVGEIERQVGRGLRQVVGIPERDGARPIAAQQPRLARPRAQARRDRAPKYQTSCSSAYLVGCIRRWRTVPTSSVLRSDLLMPQFDSARGVVTRLAQPVRRRT